jgi:hypothetical protein
MTWLILSVLAADFFTIPAADWFFPNKITTSYFECVHKAKSGTIKFYQFVKIHSGKVIEITKQNFSDIFDEEGEAYLEVAANLSKLGKQEIRDIVRVGLFVLKRMSKGLIRGSFLNSNNV